MIERYDGPQDPSGHEKNASARVALVGQVVPVPFEQFVEEIVKVPRQLSMIHMFCCAELAYLIHFPKVGVVLNWFLNGPLVSVRMYGLRPPERGKRIHDPCTFFLAPALAILLKCLTVLILSMQKFLSFLM